MGALKRRVLRGVSYVKIRDGGTCIRKGKKGKKTCKLTKKTGVRKKPKGVKKNGKRSLVK